MADDFRALNRETPMLLPPSIQEWLPEQHMARFVVERKNPGQDFRNSQARRCSASRRKGWNDGLGNWRGT